MITQPGQMINSKDVIGKDVVGDEKENLGRIDNIAFNILSGHSEYLILSCDGILGLSDKLYAIPWKLVNYDEVISAFKLNNKKIKLKPARGFDKTK